MTLKNAIKYLSKYGEVKVNSVREHWINYRGHIVSFFPNGAVSDDVSIVCQHVKRYDEKSDPNTDYFPGSFFDSLKACIRYVDRSFESDLARLQKEAQTV